MSKLAKSAHGIRLGQKVRDSVTGFTGIAVSRCEYLNGCTHYGIAPKVGSDGKAPDSVYYDWQRIEILGIGVADDFASSPTGGPQREAPRS
jgi:hypothetical protein